MPTLVGAVARTRGDGTVPTKVGTYQSDVRAHPPRHYFVGASAVCAATIACCISFSDR